MEKIIDGINCDKYFFSVYTALLFFSQIFLWYLVSTIYLGTRGRFKITQEISGFS